MGMNISVILNVNYDAGPFDLSYTTDGINWTSFDTNVSVSTLTGGTYSASLPDVAIQVKVESVGNCTNFIIMEIQPSQICQINETDCSYVLFLDSVGDLYKYSSSTNTSEFLFSSSVSNALDLAHSESKLWISDNTSIQLLEYDITLSPWSETYVRTIDTLPVIMQPGLCKSPGNNQKLVTIDDSRSPAVLVEIDVSTTPIGVRDIATLPMAATTPGDLLVTSTVQPKVIVLLGGLSLNDIYQYDYITGALEFTVSLNPFGLGWGIYEENGLVYNVYPSGQIYSIQTSSPYTVNFLQNAVFANNVVGSSQLPQCMKTIFV